MATGPILDALNEELPAVMLSRPVIVQPSTLNTVRLMHDPADANVDRWYKPGSPRPITRGNEVTWLVRDTDTYPAMIEAVRTVSDPDKHFVYLLGWSMSDFPMLRGNASPTTLGLLREVADKKVQLRVMLWSQKGPNIVPNLVPRFVQDLGWVRNPTNEPEVKAINAMPNDCAAILDNRTCSFGSHHQKVLVVNGSQGLVGFCGGLDIFVDRAHPKGQQGCVSNGAPYQDVQCRIRGPGAEELLKIFLERWDDHPMSSVVEGPVVPQIPGPMGRRKLIAVTAPVPTPQPAKGRLSVRIGRTYPNSRKHKLLDQDNVAIPPVLEFFSPNPYKFAPNGERTAGDALIHAISQARRFVYVEDQYLVSEEVSDALAKALLRIKHLTILIPHTSISDLPLREDFQPRFLNALKGAFAEKVRVFCPLPFGPDKERSYVHNKMWIIDDEFALIGSMNCNRRGLTHDSEATAGVGDASRGDTPVLTFAHRLRIRLWAIHLDMDTPAGHAELMDGVGSAVHWLNRSGTRVTEIFKTVSGGALTPGKLEAWNKAIDPDGS